MSAGFQAIERALKDEAIIQFMEENPGIWSLHRICKTPGTPTERELWRRWTAKERAP